MRRITGVLGPALLLISAAGCGGGTTTTKTSTVTVAGAAEAPQTVTETKTETVTDSIAVDDSTAAATSSASTNDDPSQFITDAGNFTDDRNQRVLHCTISATTAYPKVAETWTSCLSKILEQHGNAVTSTKLAAEGNALSLDDQCTGYVQKVIKAARALDSAIAAGARDSRSAGQMMGQTPIGSRQSSMGGAVGILSGVCS